MSMKPTQKSISRLEKQLELERTNLEIYTNILKALKLDDSDVLYFGDGIPSYGYRYTIAREFDTFESALEWLEICDPMLTYRLKESWGSTLFVPESSKLLDETYRLVTPEGEVERNKYEFVESMPWVCEINTGRTYGTTRKVKAFVNLGLDLPIQLVARVNDSCVDLDVVYRRKPGCYVAEFKAVKDIHRHFVNGFLKYASGSPENVGKVVVW